MIGTSSYVAARNFKRYFATVPSGMHPRGCGGHRTYPQPPAGRLAVFWQDGYYFRATGGPLTRFTLRSTVTSTRSAILMKGMPLFIP